MYMYTYIYIYIYIYRYIDILQTFAFIQRHSVYRQMNNSAEHICFWDVSLIVVQHGIVRVLVNAPIETRN